MKHSTPLNLSGHAALLVLLLMLACWTMPALGQPGGSPQDAFHYNRLLGRGVNMGNALEAPREGEWGMELKAEYFAKIREAGFDSVRIPIRWSAHAENSPPYTINSDFFERVDWAIDQALENGLAVVINVHHYEEIYQQPDDHRERFLAIWRQIAERYRDRPDRLFFELLNEPNSSLTDAVWNELLRDTLQVVRATNPNRMVIVGPGRWNNIGQLPQLKLPEDDRRLIATFHYYHPFQFTHQGASWAQGSEQWLGKTWGTDEERRAVEREFDEAAEWGRQNNRPLYLGEFGAYSRADMESRARWTRHVREEAERRGMSWAYWEFGAGFGVFDRQAGSWREPLLQALVGARD